MWLKAAKMYIIGGAFVALLLFAGIQHVQINRAIAVSETLRQEKAELVTLTALQADVVGTQKLAIERLAAMVNHCEEVKEKLRRDSQLISAELDRTKRSLVARVVKDKQIVKESLKNETCTDIALPSDVSSVLRARAASANRVHGG